VRRSKRGSSSTISTVRSTLGAAPTGRTWKPRSEAMLLPHQTMPGRLILFHLNQN
jgi:hypothetical protein